MTCRIDERSPTVCTRRDWLHAGVRFGAAGSLCWSGIANAAPGPRQTALVIGNGAYPGTPLRNAVNDARLVAATLRDLGFHVQQLEDAALPQMVDGLRDWLANGQDAQTRFFFYAGHGLQFRGQNYLLPVDAVLRSDADVLQRAVNASELGDGLARVPSGVSIVVLDACRNVAHNSVLLAASARTRDTRGMSGSDPGLASVLPARGTLIAYSTAPGEYALDGQGTHSAYSRHLAAVMATPGLPVEAVFKRVRVLVARDTGNRQVPWEASSIVGEHCLRPAASGACEPDAAGRRVDLRRLVSSAAK